MTYTTKIVNMGHLRKQDVLVTEMPRATFLREVDRVLGDQPERIRESLRPVAETMEVFPLDDWINSSRGCGCLVGEYLIAADHMRREDASEIHFSVRDVMLRHPDYEALEFIGEEVDERLHDRIYDNLAAGHGMPTAIIITDEAPA